MRRVVMTSATLIAILSGCGGHSAQSGQPSAPIRTRAATPTATATQTVPPGRQFPAYAVTARVHHVKVRARPGGRITHTLSNPAPLGVPLTFLLKQQSPGWLRVYLPVRPDGSTGWVRTRDVTISGVPYRIDVHQRAHRLDLYKFGRRIRRFPIGVGKTDTPTPGGVYYLKELLRPPDPHGFYGPYAFGLSGFSTVLHTFAGGSGVIGIHGTSDPSSIGRSVSHGCVRMRNTYITYLAHLLPLGTPVRIRR